MFSNKKELFTNLFNLLNDIRDDIDKEENIETTNNYNDIVKFMRNICINDNINEIKFSINKFLLSDCVENFKILHLNTLLMDSCFETLRIVIDLSYRLKLYEYINYIKDNILTSIYNPYNNDYHQRLLVYLNDDVFKLDEYDCV